MHGKLTIKQIANKVGVTKSAINLRIKKIETKDKDFHKHITIGKRGTKLIDKIGINKILTSSDKRVHVRGTRSDELIHYLISENKRLTEELDHQQQLSAHSQRIAERAQRQVAQLQIKGKMTTKHTWLWKLFH